MRILLVNNDTDVAHSMQEQPPEDAEVVILNQFQVKECADFDYDLIVIDNDANDLDQPQGLVSLEHILGQEGLAKIYYTSFEPGWVLPEVHDNPRVQVVRTDQILLLLAMEHSLPLRPVPEQPESKPQATLIISYNPIDGYKEGVYGDGKLIILSVEKRSYSQAREVLQQKLAKIYQDFDWRAERNMIKNIFVYDGLSGGDMPSQAAGALGHDVRMKATLLACGCEWSRKEQYHSSRYCHLFKVRCGGIEELGAIADMVMEIQRPNPHSAWMPPELRQIIGQGAEKYQV